MKILNESFEFIDYRLFKDEIQDNEYKNLKKIIPMSKDLQKALYDDGYAVKMPSKIKGILKETSRYFSYDSGHKSYAYAKSTLKNNKSFYYINLFVDLDSKTFNKEILYQIIPKYGLIGIINISTVNDFYIRKAEEDLTI